MNTDHDLSSLRSEFDRIRHEVSQDQVNHIPVCEGINRDPVFSFDRDHFSAGLQLENIHHFIHELVHVNSLRVHCSRMHLAFCPVQQIFHERSSSIEVIHYIGNHLLDLFA